VAGERSIRRMQGDAKRGEDGRVREGMVEGKREGGTHDLVDGRNVFRLGSEEVGKMLDAEVAVRREGR
jgi:hypothetical protein